VPVPRPSTTYLGRLVGELKSPDSQRREAALARLAVIGSRAVTPLLALAGDDAAPVAARIAALEALQAMKDRRAATLAMALSGEADDALAAAALGVLGPIAHGGDARAAKALEHLAALALNPDAAAVRRLAALDALDGLPEALMAPIWKALGSDPDPRIAARVTRTLAGVLPQLDDLVGRALPDDPDVVSAVVREDGEKASVKVLRTLIEQIRAEEKRAAPAVRDRWMAVRGQLHQSLSARGSRLALYDLKETLEDASDPLPLGFLAAIAAVGDVSCLEPLAAAWVAAGAENRWWRDHLSEAFRAIVKREDVRRRHPSMKRILERMPAAGALVALARRT